MSAPRRCVSLVVCSEINSIPRVIWIRLFLLLMVCMLAVPCVLGQAHNSAPASSPTTVGQWAAPVYFCAQKPCVVGVNAALMYTGKVLLYYYPATPDKGSQ